MADDLSNAPQTGGSEPVSTGAEPSAPAAAKTPAPSSRDAIKAAMAKVEANQPPNETSKAAAVLKEGTGADDKLVEDRAKAAKDALGEVETTNAASERAKKGWDTRRENAEKAAETDKVAEKVAAKVEEKLPKAAEPAAVETTKSTKPEPSKHQPPQRLSAEAKAAWEAAPEPLRAEVVRMHDELTAGLTKHKEGADRWAKLVDYDRQSQEAYKQPVEETLKNYVEVDKLLSQDILAGLERIVGSHGYTLKQIAEHVMGQEGVEKFDNPQLDLQRRLDSAEQRIADFEKRQTERQKQEAEQATKSIETRIAEFADKQPRWSELVDEIETQVVALKRRNPNRDALEILKLAYENAEKLNPAPSLSPPAPEIPAPDHAAQTRKGQASVSGSPGLGSNPARKPVPTTNRDAIRQALGRVGLAHS